MWLKKKILISMWLVLLVPFIPAFSAQKNIILISVDTLRADRLGSYGYSRNTSPNIDKLIASGVRFTRASTNVPLTGPAFCSLFTSRYPHQTGATRNGMPMMETEVSVTQILKDQGYTTAAVLSNWPLKAHLSGLEPGFDLYDDDFSKKRWLVFNDERDATGVTDNAIEWLDGAPKKPFFLWAHYSEPHAPYISHKGFDFSSVGKRDEAQMRTDNYDSEIAYTDNEIGRLLEKIDAMGLRSNSLIIFVADHGESLGEHGYVGHGRNLYEPCMNIPFAMAGPGIPSGVREDALVQIIDLAPTMLGFAGISTGEKMLGMNLMPYIQKQKPWPDRDIYLETYRGALPNEDLQEVFDMEKPLWIGFCRQDMKVLYSMRFSRWHLYDLGSDPREVNNTFKVTDPENVKISDHLMDWYNRWEDEGLTYGRTDALSEEDRKQLESLGYIDR
jgi:arylsulfatase A-like enzyme